MLNITNEEIRKILICEGALQYLKDHSSFYKKSYKNSSQENRNMPKEVSYKWFSPFNGKD